MLSRRSVPTAAPIAQESAAYSVSWLTSHLHVSPLGQAVQRVKSLRRSRAEEASAALSARCEPYFCKQTRYACTALSSCCCSPLPDTVVEPAPDDPPLLDPDVTPVVPLADELDGALDDAVVPEADGELDPPLLVPIDPPVDPIDEPVELVLDWPAVPPLMELDAPPLPLDVLGEADGTWLPATPAACIACSLQRSKSARLIEPAPMAPAGSNSAAIPMVANTNVRVVMIQPPV
jgi:hypothetical protein